MTHRLIQRGDKQASFAGVAVGGSKGKARSPVARGSFQEALCDEGDRSLE
jgi:hypothetical protein